MDGSCRHCRHCRAGNSPGLLQAEWGEGVLRVGRAAGSPLAPWKSQCQGQGLG